MKVVDNVHRIFCCWSLALLLAGSQLSCSRFPLAWREADALPATLATAPAGRWEGAWQSGRNRHSGALRCIVTPAGGQLPGDAGLYEFYFHATWAQVLSGAWKITCAVERDGQGGWRFQGARKLGWGMGSYRFEGSVSGKMFRASYQGKQDRGLLEMKRP